MGTESQVGWRGGDPESCDQPPSPRPRRKKENANIRTSERGRPRVTQRPRAPSPELLKQTRDQGCGSPASLPCSPSLPPTLEFPAPAVPPPHTRSRSRVLLALGVGALGLETRILLAAAGCMCVCVCACALVPTLCTALPHHTPSSCCLPFHRSSSCTSLHTCHIGSHTHSKLETCPRSPSLTHLQVGPEAPGHPPPQAHNNQHVSPS